MNLNELLPLVTAVTGAIGSYMGAIAAVKVELARHDERLNALAEKLDSHRGRLNDHISAHR